MCTEIVRTAPLPQLNTVRLGRNASLTPDVHGASRQGNTYHNMKLNTHIPHLTAGPDYYSFFHFSLTH